MGGRFFKIERCFGRVFRGFGSFGRVGVFKSVFFTRIFRGVWDVVWVVGFCVEFSSGGEVFVVWVVVLT